MKTGRFSHTVPPHHTLFLPCHSIHLRGLYKQEPLSCVDTRRRSVHSSVRQHYSTLPPMFRFSPETDGQGQEYRNICYSPKYKCPTLSICIYSHIITLAVILASKRTKDLERLCRWCGGTHYIECLPDRDWRIQYGPGLGAFAHAHLIRAWRLVGLMLRADASWEAGGMSSCRLWF